MSNAPSPSEGLPPGVRRFMNTFVDDEGFEVRWRYSHLAASHEVVRIGSAAAIAPSAQPAIGVNLDFGLALGALKAGKRVTRAGWNGADQWVSMTPGRLVPAKNLWSPHAADYAASLDKFNGHAFVADSLTLRATDGTLRMGWTPSSGDLFATDWSIL